MNDTYALGWTLLFGGIGGFGEVVSVMGAIFLGLTIIKNLMDIYYHPGRKKTGENDEDSPKQPQAGPQG